MSRRPTFILLLFLAACFVRMVLPDWMLFKEDEARAWEWANAIASGEITPVVSWTSSIGIHNSAVFVWICAAFAAIHASPVAVVLGLQFLSALAVVLLYLTVLELGVSERISRLSAWLFCFSPSAIYLSRKIWDPVPLQLFGVLSVYLLLRSFRTKSNWAVVLLFPVLALTIQIHQSGIFFAFIILVLWLFMRPKFEWRTLTGIAAGLAILAPYSIWLLENFASEWGRMADRGSVSLPDLDVLTNWILTASGLQVFHFAGKDAAPLLKWPFLGPGLLLQLMVAFIALPALFRGVRHHLQALRQSVRDRAGRWRFGSTESWLLSMICLGMPVLYFVTGVRGVHHYFLIILPFLCVLVAQGIRESGRFSLGLKPSTLVVLWGLQWAFYFSFVYVHDGGVGFGVPYPKMQEIGRELAEMTKGDAEPPAVLVRGKKITGPLPLHWKVVLEDSVNVLPCEGESQDCMAIDIEYLPGLQWRVIRE